MYKWSSKRRGMKKNEGEKMFDEIKHSEENDITHGENYCFLISNKRTGNSGTISLKYPMGRRCQPRIIYSAKNSRRKKIYFQIKL
jgi:hypothetical protein